MNRFDYVRPASVAEAVAAAAEPGRRLSRRRHQPARPDEDGRRPAEPPRRRDPAARARPDRDAAGRRRPHRRHGPQCRPRPRIAPSRAAYPAVAEALLSGASRAAAQRRDGRRQPACSARAAPISIDPASACNRREPGAGCDARGGENRGHAILGWSDGLHRHAPFRLLRAAGGARRRRRDRAARPAARELPLEELHRLPGDSPERETALAPGELIVALRLPAGGRGVPRACPLSEAARAHVVRLRAGLGRGRAARSTTGRSGRARLALGGVAAKPWRARGAEALLEGVAPTRAAFARAAEAALAEARPSGRQRLQDRARQARRRARAAARRRRDARAHARAARLRLRRHRSRRPCLTLFRLPPATSGSARTAASR